VCFLRRVVGAEERGGLCSLRESSVLIAGLVVMGRFHGEAGHTVLLLLVAGLCLGPLCKQLQFCFL